MTILEDFCDALREDCDAYSRSYLDRGCFVPLERSTDVLRIQNLIDGATQASLLREALVTYVEAMPKLTVWGRWFGVEYCGLKKRLLKTLHSRAFTQMTVLAAEVQQFAQENASYQAEVASLKSFHAALTEMNVPELRSALDNLSALRQSLVVLQEENGDLKQRLQFLSEENAQLRAQLKEAERAKSMALRSPAMRLYTHAMPMHLMGASLDSEPSHPDHGAACDATPINAWRMAASSHSATTFFS